MADESEDERLDRELIELLNELRIVLPGVQVLFAFLLTLPFSNGFPRLGDLDRDVYFVSLIAAVVSSVLLIAPTAYHRVLFRKHDKDFLITVATRLALVGMLALAVSFSCGVFVISHFVFGAVSAGIATGVTAGMSALLWFGLPFWRRLQLDRG